jgi:cell division protein FtsA
MQNETTNSNNKIENNTVMENNNNPTIIGLDIGTTKIAVIAGRKNAHGKLEILGFGRADSIGVKHGQVQNIDETIKSIQTAIANCLASNEALKEIKEVLVGIAGHHIKSTQHRGELTRLNTDVEITHEEIQQLIANQYKAFIHAGDQIIDVVPQEYTIDNFQNIINPVGYGGVKISGLFHLITGDRNAIKNINRATTKAGLEISDLVLQPLASAAAVMCATDFEAGVAIVDIGGGTTDVAVFCDGSLRHTAVIPFGGENITNDIKMGLGVLKTQAEQMKVQFGSALPQETMNNAFITIPGLRGMPAKEVSFSSLSNIINARVVEILDFVMFHLKQIGMDARQLNGGIIITGGGSQLKHIKQLTEYKTGICTRLGLPNEHLASNHPKELANPMYATCLGLILKGYHTWETSELIKNNGINATLVSQIETQNALPPEVDEVENITEVSNAFDDAADQNTATENTTEQAVEVKGRKKNLSSFLDNMKTGLINIFKEEDDKEL